MAETNGQALAKRWNDWRSSQEGTRCCDFSTIGNGQYLENRLWRAFMAGAAAPSLPSAGELARKMWEKSGSPKHRAATWEDICFTERGREYLSWAKATLAALSSDKVSKDPCPQCKGTGKVHCGHGIHLNECPSTCSGTKKCPDCNGCGKTNNGVGDERKG